MGATADIFRGGDAAKRYLFVFVLLAPVMFSTLIRGGAGTERLFARRRERPDLRWAWPRPADRRFRIRRLYGALVRSVLVRRDDAELLDAGAR